jgi:hypothetical protein
MYVHERARLIYLAHPRTASRSTVRALSMQGFVHVGREHHDRLSAGYAPEKMSTRPALREALDEFLVWKERGSWDVATTVRHHVDALVSWAFYLNSAPVPSFLEYLTDREAKYFPEPDSLWSLHGTVSNTILRFEDLEADLTDWLIGRGLQHVRLPYENAGTRRRGRPWQEVATEEFTSAVVERYGDEMKGLDYDVPAS